MSSQPILAAQLYTLREFTQTAVSLRDTLLKVRDIGYTAVQLSAIGPIPPETVKAYLDEAGLTCCITHVPFERLREDLTAVIAEHKLWDCQHVGLGAMPLTYRAGGEAGYRTFANILNEIGAQLFEVGLTFSYHNHSFEFQRFGAQTGLNILFTETDPRYLHAILDVYWVQHGGGDPAAWIRKLQGRQTVVHYKDMVIDNNQQLFAEVGEGNLNWAAINQAVRETAVSYIAVEQDICQRDPFESLAISYANLKEWGFS